MARFLDGVGIQRYEADDLVRAAVERQFGIIGEALAQLARIEPDMAARVPDCKQIIGFRNVLVHGYASLDNAQVWRVAQLRLPALTAAVDAMLATSGSRADDPGT